MSLQKNQLTELTIDRLAHGGAGVGRVDGLAVFVPGSAPGDRLRVRVTKRKAQHAEAKIEEILEPSPIRQDSECPIFGECGGCKWLHIPYTEQAKVKRQIIEETFAHLGKIPHPPLEDIRTSPDVYRYRNKMDLTFGRDRDGQTVLGFHRAGQFDEIIDAPLCLLQPTNFDRLVAVFRDYARRENLPPYEPRTHQGFLRSVILREGRATGDTLAVLITAEPPPSPVGKGAGGLGHMSQLIADLRAACPSLKGFLWGINTGKADIARIDRVAHLWGSDVIHERIGNLTFAISALSFFQTNTPATELLYESVAECLDLSGNEVLLDAFCGTGTIGIFCAARCKHVYGIEIHLPAVLDARKNAAANGLTNCTFLAGDVRETLTLVRHVAGASINRIVVDPPRGGMHQKALAQLIDLRVPVFVYVSCNPTTLARDLQDLHAAGYTIERVIPLDLFPHTYHVETVVRLTR